MKRLFAVAFALAALCSVANAQSVGNANNFVVGAVSSGNNITIVGATGASNGSGGGTTASVSYTATAGNFVVVACMNVGNALSGGAITVSDGGSDTFTVALHNTTTYPFAVSYASNVVGGLKTYTCTYPVSATFLRADVVELSKVANSSPVDQTGSNASTSTTSISASLVNTNADDVILGFMYTGGGATGKSFNSGFTQITGSPSGFGMSQLVTSTGTYTPGGSWTGSVDASLAGISLKSQ